MATRNAPSRSSANAPAAGTSGPIVLAPSPPRRRVNLATLDDVARELGYLYRQVDRGLLPAAEATRRAYLLQVLTKTLEVTVIERRLDALEEVHGT